MENKEFVSKENTLDASKENGQVQRTDKQAGESWRKKWTEQIGEFKTW